MFTSFLLVICGVYTQTTYYVSKETSGVDNSECGGESSPCASINQVLINYPGESYIVSIGWGDNLITKIPLEQSAKVIFQGAGVENTTIYTNDTWNVSNSTFITNTPSSGFEFHDLTLEVYRTLRGYFTYLDSEENAVGFYNVDVTCSWNIVVVGLMGGVVVMERCIFSSSYSYVIVKNNIDEGTATSVNITGCAFSDVMNQFGGLVYLSGPGVTEMVLDNSSFFNVTTTVHFVTAELIDAGGKVTVTNNVFNITVGFRPALAIGLSQYNYDIVVRNTTFINCTSSQFFSGALGINRTDTSVTDNPVTLDTLRFENCTGIFAGALYVGYNSFILTHSSFDSNKGTEVDDDEDDDDDEKKKIVSCSDIFFAVPSVSAGFKYSVVDTYSLSVLFPTAVIWSDETNSTTDISYILPKSKPVDGGGGGTGNKNPPYVIIAIVVVAAVVVLIIIIVAIVLLVVRSRRRRKRRGGASSSSSSSSSGESVNTEGGAYTKY